MATLSISKATSFHFRLATGPGSANDGAFLDGNYLYPDIAAFYNCSGADCGIHPDNHHKPQIYNTADGIINFQIEYNNSGTAPVIQAFDATDDSFVLSIVPVNVGGDQWLASVSMTALGEGCFYIKISTLGTASGQNSFLQGDFGTMEANITNLADANTGNFAISQSAAQAEAGTMSYLRAYSAGAPSTDDKLILYNSISTAYDFSATNGLWEIKGFVYLPSGAEYVTGQNITWDITNSDGFGTPASAGTGWTDANILSTTVYNRGSDGLDAWFEVSTIFQTVLDQVGYFRLTSDKTPEVDGDIHVDTITLRQVSNSVCEATSETFYIKDNHDCSTKIVYTNTDDGFDIDYTSVPFDHCIRIIYDGLFKFAVQDPDFIIEDESNGTVLTKTAFPQKVYTVVFGSLTEAMAEKLILASKHDTFKMDGIQLVPIEGDVQPEWKEETGFCTVTMQLRLQTYNYQNSNC